MLNVTSEVGPLRRVIVHRPGIELARLTPTNAAELLFDDILWLERAEQEHDVFAEALASSGAEVLHFDDLLRRTLAVPEALAWVLDETIDERTFGPTWRRRCASTSTTPPLTSSTASWWAD
ncbi:arginine deiminase [Tessaracoccus flavus]|nr:arginine deiminase [Tessaracoccus flavus]